MNAIVLLVASSILSLNGDGWKLDGVPVSVPHTWNADDYDKGFADGLGAADFRRNVDSGNSVGLRPGENEIVLLQEVAAGEEVVDGDVFYDGGVCPRQGTGRRNRAG